mmetsp:Transcript_352/g.1282  ORF Transcript_352/g.1282 Transcript_352/m.1282 type:complete len:305 (-) Transcript_352:1169-2083(-)
MASSSAAAVAYYAIPGPLTSLSSKWDGVVAGLPSTAAAIAEVVANLCLHDVVASHYGVELSDSRLLELQVRDAETVVEKLAALKTSFRKRRKPSERFVCRCRTFATLAVAFCRAKGIPARARCGFATYFVNDKFEDHWIMEYRDQEGGGTNAWKRIDPQLDDYWLKKLSMESQLLERRPRRAFLSGAEAWKKWRSDKACDPDDFGLSFQDLRGSWFMAGNVLRDLAALAKLEMLPWDVWGAMPKPNADITKDEFALFDHVADLALDPDANFDELQKIFAENPQLRFPGACYNAFTNDVDTINLD